MQYNTVVSAVMKMLNALSDAGERDGALLRESLGILLRVLYPIAPHIAHALWGELGFGGGLGNLLDAPWPRPDPGALQMDVIEWVVQVNGKLRGSIRIPAGADRPAIESAVLADASIRRHLTGAVKKVVIVPGKLVNVVV
jgi:leucyl-tRNA synthetase